jgi:hypothetical protein
MDYSAILNELDQATGFDLFRLQAAIDRMLDDPARIGELKRLVRVGDEVDYFDPAENRLVPARVLKCGRTRVDVVNLDDGKRWRILYCAINIFEEDVAIAEGRRERGVGRNELSVGDTVGFVDANGALRCGNVVRLNRNTVTLDCRGSKWRVAYSLLSHVIDLDQSDGPNHSADDAIPLLRHSNPGLLTLNVASREVPAESEDV